VVPRWTVQKKPRRGKSLLFDMGEGAIWDVSVPTMKTLSTKEGKWKLVKCRGKQNAKTEGKDPHSAIQQAKNLFRTAGEGHQKGLREGQGSGKKTQRKQGWHV